MAQAVAEELGGIPMSPALQATLLRAREYAADQSHREVTLEHLLLALSEDEDAAAVMQSCRVDLGRLRHDVAGFLGSLNDRSAPPHQPSISPPLTQILKYATLAAQQGRRPRIDGAIVLAAIVGDGKSMAASFLKAQGLTFEQAVRVLQQSIRDAGRPPPRPEPPQVAQSPGPARLEAPREDAAPPPQPMPQLGAAPSAPHAEDILAAARARVVSRVPKLQPVEAPEAAPYLAEQHVQLDPPPSSALPPPPAAAPAPEAGWQSPEPDIPALETTAWPEEPPPVERTGGHAARTVTQPPPEAPPQLPPSPPPAAAAPAPAQQPSPTSWTPPPATMPSAQSPFPPARPPLPPLTPLGAGPPRPLVAPGMAPPSPFQSAPPPQAAPPPWGTPNERRPSPPPQQVQAPPPMQRTGPPQPAFEAYPQGPPSARTPAIELSQLSHSIPARLIVGRPRTVEVQVKRQPLGSAGSASRPAPQRGDVVTARAITVRVRPAKGRFVIDQPSTETQWDKASDGSRLAGEAAVWRFTIQPLAKGEGELLLTVAARTIAADGMILESALPDQVIPVRTGRDWAATFRRAGLLALVSVGSIVLEAMLEAVLKFDVLKAIQALLRF